jgi:maltose alpha-D-glucosyltransferase/alpha-amylase
VVYYGDELGMGDNVFLGDRDGVRTPMQWSGDRNAGFSRADEHQLYMPLIRDPVYGYEAVNVEAQERTPTSILAWMRRVMGIRRSYPAFGRGTIRFCEPANPHVFAFLRDTRTPSSSAPTTCRASASPPNSISRTIRATGRWNSSVACPSR